MSGPLELEVSPRARDLLARVAQDHRDLSVLLDDTTCCTVSNVLVREGRPPWQASELGDVRGVKFFAHPTLLRSLGQRRRILIDALDSTDDSLSLETNYGGRLVMLLAAR